MGKIFSVLVLLLAVAGCGEKSKAELIKELEYEEKEIARYRSIIEESPGDLSVLKRAVSNFESLPENKKTDKEAKQIAEMRQAIASGERGLVEAHEKLPGRLKARSELREKIDSMK